MFGAICGDIIGSYYEFRGKKAKTTQFPLFRRGRSRFTDDTELTVAVADCLLHNKDYATVFRQYGQLFPDAGYGCMFREWLASPDPRPYNSYGNGSAMRVSPVGFAFDTLDEVLMEAKRSADVTHNHPEGIKGAQAIAAAIFLARTGKDKREITEYIESQFGYNLHHTLDEIRPAYRFDETCQVSVPEAIIAFVESTDYETAIRNAVSLGGDADTLACMAGAIAEAYYKHIPDFIVTKVRAMLDERMMAIVDEFEDRYGLMPDMATLC